MPRWGQFLQQLYAMGREPLCGAFCLVPSQQTLPALQGCRNSPSRDVPCGDPKEAQFPLIYVIVSVSHSLALL